MAESPASGWDHDMHRSPCSVEGMDGCLCLTRDPRPAWLPPFQRGPRAQARTEGCAQEFPPMAGLAGEFGLENKLRPMLMWLRRHIIRVEVHPIELLLEVPMGPLKSLG